MLGITLTEDHFPFPIRYPTAHHTESWNRFWEQVLSIEEASTLIRLMPEQCMLLNRIKSLQQAGATNILFVGNGISALPHLFAYTGFNVDAFDISEVATDFNTKSPPGEEYYLRFFGGALSYAQYGNTIDGLNPITDEITAHLRKNVALWKSEQGSLRLFTRSIFDWNVASQYDCVFAFNFLDLLDDTAASEALQRIHRSLKDSGILVAAGPVLNYIQGDRVSVEEMATVFSLFETNGFDFIDKNAIIHYRRHRIAALLRWRHASSFDAMIRGTPVGISKKATCRLWQPM